MPDTKNLNNDSVCSLLLRPWPSEPFTKFYWNCFRVYFWLMQIGIFLSNTQTISIFFELMQQVRYSHLVNFSEKLSKFHQFVQIITIIWFRKTPPRLTEHSFDTFSRFNWKNDLKLLFKIRIFLLVFKIIRIYFWSQCNKLTLFI